MSEENNTPVKEATVVEESSTPTGNSADYSMGMLCHLLSFCGYLVPVGNIVGPLVLWLTKKDEDAFLDATGKEVLNFQISMTIYTIICGLLMIVVIGIFLLPIVLIANIVYTIIGAIKANEGKVYQYPFTMRFLK